MRYSKKILCFSWNTEQTPLCEAYLNNETKNLIDKPRGTFSKTTSCYNPLFFDEIKTDIRNYIPEMIVFFTEGDLGNGTWFHSDFLPDKMIRVLDGISFYSYKLLSRDKYSGQLNTVMRMSIYVILLDSTTKNIELSKGYLFNDNTLDCQIRNKNNQGQDYTENAKILALYTQGDLGTIAFIGVQYGETNPNEGRMCIKQLEEKFINNKQIDYVFIMGDFSNDIKAGLSRLNDPVTGRTLLSYNIDERIKEFKKLELDTVPEKYRSNKTNDDKIPKDLDEMGFTFVESPNIETAERRKTQSNNFLMNVKVGYHDRILHRTVNNNKKQMTCEEYKVIKELPKNPEHRAILGVYQL